ncbi:S-layer homology domain-containing protein [Bacillus sp. ISL-47]|uniref:S-layer homology domain-containing protein n=1 Tax=Bacillus sp. ISL-47 TaxID=2819130 RepID=UPI001BEC478C|nr:S-layer homology domain-containing protein [Bacillus sp. ISL-47]MBT2689209.1 S-layer homology domain-containing protein [Bacillus sp. ISL-47]MBT2708670.1 S-layer homology domain-containing protein [Pseudomonas sp. ISL-84]
MNFKKFTSLILVFLLVFSTYTPVMAEKLSDIKGHWAEEQIESSIEEGLVEGYPNGTFRPNGTITRAEFITIVNRKFDYTEKATVGFPDVKADDWYADAISVAMEAGYIDGFDDGTMRPKSPITRQEAAVILARILDLPENTGDAEVFKDSIPEWSKGSIGAVASKGLMEGFPGAKFEPKKAITRAESIVTLNRVPSETITYDKAGVYGPKSGSETIKGDVKVTTDGVVLQNLVIKGDLLVAASVGEGDVNFNNVVVEGTTRVYGGGENSIHVNNSTLNKLIVDKENDKVRVVVTGTTSVIEVTVKSGAKLEESKLTGKGFNNISVEAPESSIVIFDGEFESVVINSSDVTINLPSGASVKILTINKKAAVKGNGTIEEANVNADGVKLDINPRKLNVKAGVQNPGGTTTGGGGEVTYTPPSTEQPDDEAGEDPIRIINIEDMVETVSLGDEVVLPATVSARMSDNTQADKQITWSGKAFTNDIGTFEYEGVVEGYNRVVKYTLTVELTGYSENEDGTIAYVSNTAAAEHAENVITVEEVVIKGSFSLPLNYSLPVTVDTDNVTVNLQNSTLVKVTVAADNVTLKNGTINEIVYGEDIQSITLENILDASTTKHVFSHDVSEINLLGTTDLSGDIYLQGGSVVLDGDGEISGIVRVDTTQPVTISLTVATVIVNAENATINLTDHIENMIVRQNATVNLGSGATITNPEKRSGVIVTVNTDVSFQVSTMRAQTASTLNFAEVLDTVDLERYIHVAGNFTEAAEPGDLDGQFPQSAIDALSQAKTNAGSKLQEIKNSSGDLAMKQSNIDSESVQLAEALTQFGKSRIFLDTTSLRNKLRAMEQLLARTAIGETHGHVPEDAYNAFKTIVEEVKTAFLTGLTEAQVNAEVQKLEEAHVAFQEAYIELPFFDPDSSTIEGLVSFNLTDPEERFTDFSNFKVLETEGNASYYSETGWSIGGREEDNWRTMEVLVLNHHSVNLNEVDKVYYTVATNKHIYTGTFTIDQFLDESEITLTPVSETTGKVNVSIPSAGGDFNLAGLVATRTDENLEDQWVETNEIAQTTNLPIGDYTIEVYGYDDEHEYILKKDIQVTEGDNPVIFPESDMESVTLNYENFTGWNLKPHQYRPNDSRLRYFHRYEEEEREVNSSLKLTNKYDGLTVGYYANHPERDGEQWRYQVRISDEQLAENAEITSTPHFEFNVEKHQPALTVINPTAPLYSYFNINIINEFGHVLQDLYFYHDYSYLEYGGEVSIKDASGTVKSKKVDNIWRYGVLSVNDIFPGATGQLEITFSLKDTPFLIPDKKINVTIAE